MVAVFSPDGPDLANLSVEELLTRTAQVLLQLSSEPQPQDEVREELILELNALRAARASSPELEPGFFSQLVDITEAGITEDQNILERAARRTLNILASPFGGDAASVTEVVSGDRARNTVLLVVLGVSGVLVTFLFLRK